ncbi:hypothetical protein L915_05932 [Phytophthora nicotianae]|uniref:Uncharacterized protein n=1 Tax=Phytophthora nicotianae TaxID=4792 RepID=W2H706_PHYNI|nr:hypothetical protein L915_05932 [Phytophthora nicotianae]
MTKDTSPPNVHQVKLDSHSAVKNRRTTVLRIGDGWNDFSVGATGRLTLGGDLRRREDS